ncbi:hypothetical protein ACZ90_66655 [Streptomyces albus subsp. albus]|nr:hypothetical protein ACZ90_66655 [Streptomyces albus subsp. albus]
MYLSPSLLTSMVLRETSRSFAIEVTVFFGPLSRKRACWICSGVMAGGRPRRGATDAGGVQTLGPVR